MSLKEPVKQLTIQCSKSVRELIELIIPDLKSTTKAQDIEFGKAKIEVNEKIKINIKL